MAIVSHYFTPTPLIFTSLHNNFVTIENNKNKSQSQAKERDASSSRVSSNKTDDKKNICDCHGNEYLLIIQASLNSNISFLFISFLLNLCWKLLFQHYTNSVVLSLISKLISTAVFSSVFGHKSIILQKSTLQCILGNSTKIPQTA